MYILKTSLPQKKNVDIWEEKVLVPTSQHIRTLTSARLAADALGVPTVIIARTDALAANLLTSDIDDNDKDFVLGERTSEGFFKVKNGPEAAFSRALSYAPYADLVWCETGNSGHWVCKRLCRCSS